MKSKGILFLATIVIAVMIIVSVSATVYKLHPTSGIDTTPSEFPSNHTLTPTELGYVSASDNQWYWNVGSWYWGYEDNEYIEYSNFRSVYEIPEDQMPRDCKIVSAKVLFEWHRNAGPDDQELRIGFGGNSWPEQLDLDRSLEDVNVTWNVTLFVNTMQKVNDFKLQFRALDHQNEPRSLTYHDLVELQVECDNEVPETGVNHFTHIDRTSEPISCKDGHTWLPYTSSIVVHGVSTDESGVSGAQYGWDVLILPWESALHLEGETNWGDPTVDWFSDQGFVSYPLTPGHHRVCARARDTLGNQELLGATDVWTIPSRQDYNNECCDVCIDLGGLNPTINKTIGTPNVTKNNITYMTSDTEITLSCTNIHDIPCSPPTYLKYSIDGVPAGQVNGQGENKLDTSFYIGEQYADGLHTVSYECGTEAGGITTGSETDFLDNTGPTVHKEVGTPKVHYTDGDNESKDEGFYVTNHTEFTFACDDHGGVDTETVNVWNNGVLSHDGAAPWTTVFLTPVNGEFNLTYYCTDELGNRDQAKVRAETDFMDNEGPVINLTEPNSYENRFGCGSNMFTVMATITNGGVGVEGANATLNGRTYPLRYDQDLNSWIGDVNHWGIPAGSYYLIITAWDYLGNTNTFDYEITLDADVNFQDPTGDISCCPKGSTCTYDFNVTMCHGGNATAMIMSKVCGTGQWHPTLWYSQNSVPVLQVPWSQFLGYLSGSFPDSPWNFLEVPTNAIVHLNITVPTGWQGGASDDCKILKFKWIAGNTDSPIRLNPHDDAPFPYNLEGLGWFNINNKQDCVEFNIGESQCTPSRPTNTCGIDNCGDRYNNCDPAGYDCQNNKCVRTISHHGGGGGGSNNAVTPSCTENWRCGPWGVCVTDMHYRVCVDGNNCNTFNNKPAESEACANTGAEGSSSGNQNANNGNTPLTGAAVGASPLIGGILFVLIVALAVVVTIVARRLTEKSKK